MALTSLGHPSVFCHFERHLNEDVLFNCDSYRNDFCGFRFVGCTAKKPNILVIWGDDIGTENISYYNRGMMGYQTPNIDRIAKGGIFFTDYYGQQSCTAGRAAFINGSVPVRTGMTKVGIPGARKVGRKPTSRWPP